MLVIGYNHVQRIYSPGKNKDVNFIGGWMGSITGLAVREKKNLWFLQEFESFFGFSSAVQTELYLWNSVSSETKFAQSVYCM